jgi:DNA-directed RNA polymerase subunit M/transcription elongation factor TFIIS
MLSLSAHAAHRRCSANLNISRDTTLDPALKRTKAIKCPKCGHDEACFFARSDEKMELVFVCTDIDCSFHWITQNDDAKAPDQGMGV